MRDIQKDLEICEKATPGPWEILHGGEDFSDKIITPCTGEWREEIATELLRVDAEFIVMAREALPYYITELQKTQAEAAALKEIAEHYYNYFYEKAVKTHGLNYTRSEIAKKAQKALSSTAGQELLDRIKALEEALKDAIETMEYALKYVEGGGLSVEDDLNRSLKLARTALNKNCE